LEFRRVLFRSPRAGRQQSWYRFSRPAAVARGVPTAGAAPAERAPSGEELARDVPHRRQKTRRRPRTTAGPSSLTDQAGGYTPIALAFSVCQKMSAISSM